ncbi:MAG: hypothetical protein UY48_C0003G0091 [Candidatus Gottesmanbacteria bacterium GW2011_GWB1_49_7]|uniref:Glycosyl transferase family 1 domain-containing protein n=1 Tax=Candidatus Gottesmanbacteria bacterium GW2011_GWB1_49_7 TaxID=1618448 RepID=A0A0G1Z3B6_9BACT|nr:MAG: hypothetical protein UY48_C0003G0091 [Candidatus Gottesmanbacteria bacterium GW2011_GWB1_49_7]
MRIFVDDMSSGIGGGQRWSKDFAHWLIGRGHQVKLATRTENIVGFAGEPTEVYFDMAPHGNTYRYPKGAKVFLWCHVPSSLSFQDEALKVAEVIASSKWSAAQVHNTWSVTPKVLMPFGKPVVNRRNSGSYGLFVGRLTMAKGAIAALRIHRRCDRAFPLVMVGATWSSPLFDKTVIRNQAAAQGVTLIEDASEFKIKELYLDARVFFQLAGLDKNPPEAFGLAAADAYLSGIPVLAYPAGAIREWLPEEWWINDADPKDIMGKWDRADSFIPDSKVVYEISEQGFTERAKSVLGSWV